MLDLEKNGLRWAEKALADLAVPVATFPGDDEVPLPYAVAMAHDPKQMRLPIITMRGVTKVALKYGVHMTPQLFESIKRMAIAPEAADFYLDEPNLSPKDRKRRHDLGAAAVHDLFERQPGETPSLASLTLAEEDPLLSGALEYWGNSVRVMPELSREKIKKHALGCIALSHQKVTADNFTNYVRLTAAESEQYGFMWADTAWSEQNEGDSAAYQDFHRWMGSFVSAISVFGATFDLRKDERNGNVNFHPKIPLHSALLVARSLKDAPYLASTFVGWKTGSFERRLERQSNSR